MEERKLTCIGCPMGCPLTVVMNGEEVVSVTGNTCKRGDVYARKEVTNPTRIVTSTVRNQKQNTTDSYCQGKQIDQKSFSGKIQTI